jgi:hypothetical protein
MPLEDRNLEAGTRLAAKYKGQTYGAEVVQTEEGVRYRLEDGREFKSPSSAASAVMGGMAANGWRFWSLAGTEAETAAGAPKPPKKGKAKSTGDPEEAVVCGECGETFATSAEATEHMATAHTDAQPPA